GATTSGGRPPEWRPDPGGPRPGRSWPERRRAAVAASPPGMREGRPAKGGGGIGGTGSVLTGGRGAYRSRPMAQLGVRPPIQVQMTPCVMACSFPLDPLPDTRIHPRQPSGFRRTSHSPQLLCYTSESSLRRLVTSDRCVLGDAMVAADPVSAKPRGVIAARAARWPLLGERRALVGYVCSVVALYLVTLSGALLATRVEARDVATFVALLACGAVCIEARRRLGVPAGVSRDLLSAWWLPAALLLPPAYALLLPLPLQFLLHLRVRETVVYRRVFSAAAIGLAAGAASMLFHRIAPRSEERRVGKGCRASW